ncbi:MAG: hypothetical protein K2Y32_07130 [Candidatus Obscuribacterales bacterium]|nr:hypothetical protein [Candidatus Obscuribacterales bacterium]
MVAKIVSNMFSNIFRNIAGNLRLVGKAMSILAISSILSVSGAWAGPSPKEAAKGGLTRYDFRLEQISCAKCLLNIRQALRKADGIIKCEVALRKPYGAVIIADAKANEAKIKDIVAGADPGTHPKAVDFIAEPVKEVPVVLLPKHNGLKKD